MGKIIVVAAGLLTFISILSKAQAHSFEVLYAFGDSYTDSGAGYIDGNGPTAVVYLANSLSIPFTYAGDSNASGKGLNFAVSGAQTGEGGMKNQVLEFVRRAQSDNIKFKKERTLFFLAGGLNDGELPTATTITNLEGEIQDLYKAGGRYFLVALLPTKIPAFSAVGARLNPAIAKIPKDLHASLPGAHIKVSHWGEYFDRVLENPATYGIVNTSDRCAGRAIFGEDSTPCSAPDTYFYYHDGHPSTAVQRIVATDLTRELERFP
jgi:phospholipase/lecithinase/hemolysin